jgi:enoyl-[acyl-carrier protein] reductase I
MLHHAEQRAPMRRTTTLEDVGGAALFLCSDWSAGVTGEVLHVDCGYHVMGA